MKVLGTTGQGFLIECTDAELCNLMGFASEHLYSGQYHDAVKSDSNAGKRFKEANGAQFGTPNKKIDWVGLSLPIADIFRASRKVAEGWNQDYDFKSAVKFLNTFADQLNMIAGTYMPLKDQK